MSAPEEASGIIEARDVVLSFGQTPALRGVAPNSSGTRCSARARYWSANSTGESTLLHIPWASDTAFLRIPWKL